MNIKKIASTFVACVLVVICLFVDTMACTVNHQDFAVEIRTVTRASGRINAELPANSFTTIDDSFFMVSGETITFDCTYTPRDANVEFGYIAPDGLFYGLSGYKGSINKGIRVNQQGTYTLAIWNKSDSSVTVTGTVNY